MVTTAEHKRTPDSDSDLSRRGKVGAVAKVEPMELMEPFGFALALGGGDCVDRSAVLSIEPLGPDELGVPSDV